MIRLILSHATSSFRSSVHLSIIYISTSLLFGFYIFYFLCPVSHPFFYSVKRIFCSVTFTPCHPHFLGCLRIFLSFSIFFLSIAFNFSSSLYFAVALIDHGRDDFEWKWEKKLFGETFEYERNISQVLKCIKIKEKNLLKARKILIKNYKQIFLKLKFLGDSFCLTIPGCKSIRHANRLTLQLELVQRLPFNKQ